MHGIGKLYFMYISHTLRKINARNNIMIKQYLTANKRNTNTRGCVINHHYAWNGRSTFSIKFKVDALPRYRSDSFINVYHHTSHKRDVFL